MKRNRTMNIMAKLLFPAVLITFPTSFATALPDNAVYFCETFETVKLFADSDRKVIKIIEEVPINYLVDLYHFRPTAVYISN